VGTGTAVIEKPWKVKRSYSREELHRETYTKQDPIEFLKKEGGVLQEDGSWVMKRGLILRKNSPIVKNGRFIVKIKRSDFHFNCSGQSLISLEGCPEIVKGNFWCGSNPRLKSLKHGPRIVEGDYCCSYTGITSLRSLKGVEFESLDVEGCKLTSMKSFPKFINGYLNAKYNKFESLEGMPQTKEYADFNGNPLKTLYGFKIPLGSDIVKFSYDEECGCILTNAEIDFVMHQQYDLGKVYKNYHYQLLKRAVNKGFIDDIEKIRWPEKMVKSGKIQNALNSLKSIKKFKL
jgi:hypothetical protein